MTEELQVRGMVLSTAPSGEYDRRVCLLTRERGKITAFARGARKPTSAMLAGTNPFAFGTFHVYEGRNAFTLTKTEISHYFRDLMEDFTATCYGTYFLEIADYYSRENLDASGLLNLLYVSLGALTRRQIPFSLIRAAFEIRAMVTEGEYPQDLALDPSVSEAVRYALSYIISAPLNRLFAFNLRQDALDELLRLQADTREKIWPREFKSMEVLRTMTMVS